MKILFTCDHCQETWDLRFKCETCSDKLELVECEVPNIHWSGTPSDDEFILGEEMVNTGNVCRNCCNC